MNLSTSEGPRLAGVTTVVITRLPIFNLEVVRTRERHDTEEDILTAEAATTEARVKTKRLLRYIGSWKERLWIDYWILF